MKSLFTLRRSGIMAALLLFTAAPSMAQDVETTSYVNAFVHATAVGEGKLALMSLDKSGIPVYRVERDYKSQFPVMMGTQVVFLGSAKSDGDAKFFGWFLDDGDGQLDITKDELVATSAEDAFLSFPIEMLGEDVAEYATAAEAKKAASYPDAPQVQFFAYFFNGVSAGVNYHQDLMGTVDVDKFPNAVGDEVTVEAFPADGYEFLYWKDRLDPKDAVVVSEENPYTFTVDKPQTLYAVFRDLTAPVVEFPAEGGFRAMSFDKPWVFDERADVMVYVLSLNELRAHDQGRTYFDLTAEDSHFDITQTYDNTATLMYGKGSAPLLFREQNGYSRHNPIVKWATKGTTVKEGADAVPVYVYIFHEDLGAFLQYAHTDFYQHPESAQQTIELPENVAYVSIDAISLTDSEGNIPSVIAMSPEAYDQITTAVEGISPKQATVGQTKIYTLSGVEVKTTDQPGIYVVNGRKVSVRK